MTKGSDTRPTRRVLMARSRFGAIDSYVVELRESLIVLRPKGAKRGGPREVVVLPGAVYLDAIRRRVDAERRERKAKRKRKS